MPELDGVADRRSGYGGAVCTMFRTESQQDNRQIMFANSIDGAS